MAMPKNNSPHIVNPGDKFERLTVVKFSHLDSFYRRHYVVVCSCGTIKTVQGSLLRSGNTRSCGCLASELKKSRALPNQRGVINQIVLSYKRHAMSRGISFRLTSDDVSTLVRQPCHYCGIVGGNNIRTKNCKSGFRYNGIDRIDSFKDYTVDNVVACCKQCNLAKRDMSADTFVQFVFRVADYQKQKLNEEKEHETIGV